jgi:hypothetical protein
MILDTNICQTPDTTWFEHWLTCIMTSAITMPSMWYPSLDMTPMMILYNMKNSPYSSWMSMMAMDSIRHSNLFIISNSLSHGYLNSISTLFHIPSTCHKTNINNHIHEQIVLVLEIKHHFIQVTLRKKNLLLKM